MRSFIFFFIVIFSLQSLSKADDIRDFEIEGISVGDSLLDYFDKSELTKDYFYKSKKWAAIAKAMPSFEIYGGFQAHVKSDDPRYIIGSLEGMILYKKNFKNCYKKQKEITMVLDEYFKNAEIKEWESAHTADKDSISKTKQYRLKNGDIARVTCTDWSDKMNFIDKLKVGLHTKEFDIWINNEAYE